MLLHDERFSGWSLEEKLNRFHFSKRYLRFCRSNGWEPYLYCFHESVKEKQVYDLEGLGIIKVFPVSFRMPPLLRFGNDHNPRAILKELAADEPDIIHFHDYYLFSFAYLVPLIKKMLSCPLTTQLHGYHLSLRRRLPYLPSLQRLKEVDRIFYSYGPEETVYRKLGVEDKAVKVPIPSIDPEQFKPCPKEETENLLYVGRLPGRTNAYAEKSPVLLLYILKKLRQLRDADLTILGDGKGLSNLIRLARKLGISDSVEFNGFIPHSEVSEFYQRARMTLVPLKLYDIDGFFDGGIQESLGCGTPVAALKSTRDTPLRGRFGFLLSEGYDKAAQELSKLLDEPHTLNDSAHKGSSFIHMYCTEERLKSTLLSEWEGALKR